MSEWLDKAIDKGKDAAREAEVKVRDAVEEHADQIKGGIEKAAGFVHDKTKGRFGDSVGKVEEAAKGTARQTVTVKAGIDSDHAKQINKAIKDMGLKGIQSQTQGEQVRVTGKKRDDLQAVIQGLKEADFDVPLQFINFRD
jgi:uncharacterized protein YajQ (UPF0234 family)